jgi:hypothetical protein
MNSNRLHNSPVALLVLALVIGTAIAGCGARNAAAPIGSTTQQQSLLGRGIPQPAPTATDGLFAADGTTGIAEINIHTGKTVTTFGSSFGQTLDTTMDDQGNVYDDSFTGSGIAVNRLVIGGNSSTATYLPTAQSAAIVFAAPTGEVITGGANFTSGRISQSVFDVWDAGSAGGPPSRTFSYTDPPGQGTPINITWAPDGTIYLPYTSPKTQKQQYDVIPPGQSKPSRTIVDSIVPAGTPFSVNWMRLGPDGTLYVAEWAYSATDQVAGLYIYPRKGKETYVASGASAPTGIDLDDAGNVYVLNSNSVLSISPPGLTPDTLHTLSVYAPHATSLLRQVKKGFSNGQFLTVDDDGTAYIEDFTDVKLSTELLVVVAPTATKGRHLAKIATGTGFFLYNGHRVKTVGTGVNGGSHAGLRIQSGRLPGL